MNQSLHSSDFSQKSLNGFTPTHPARTSPIYKDKTLYIPILFLQTGLVFEAFFNFLFIYF